MDDFQKEVNELLARAMQQPGVAAILEMQESQRPAVEAYKAVAQAVAPRWVVMASTSSATTAQ